MLNVTKLVFLMLIVASRIGFIDASISGASKIKQETKSVSLCDLLQRPADYDNKVVRFRAKYVSTFEVSTFIQNKCEHTDKSVWVEFDDRAIHDSTKPVVLKKLSDQVYCCLWSGSSIRETEMLVTAIFHKTTEEGYGHGHEYRFLVVVKQVQHIGATNTIKVPGF